ncbi:MAG: YjgB family protein [Steroidobacteraceae bacterium]|jgi:hypothetical protein|nr:YjgB family protein [Steroidobacteraceae bacterium]
MATRGAPEVLRWAALPAVALILAGCPIPLPAGYEASSRENVSAEPLDWVTIGVTTREDVLLKLGEADGAAPDGTWLAYGSAYSKGGVVFVLFAGGSAAGVGSERMEYRRIVISFDEKGVLSAIEPVTRDCWEGILGMGSSGERSPPCLKIESRE